VTAHRTGEQGMIFRDLVDDLDENIDPNTVFNWFHPNVTKSEAVDMLVKCKIVIFFIINYINLPSLIPLESYHLKDILLSRWSREFSC
jgi:Ras GTPase-activating protein 1